MVAQCSIWRALSAGSLFLLACRMVPPDSRQSLELAARRIHSQFSRLCTSLSLSTVGSGHAQWPALSLGIVLQWPVYEYRMVIIFRERAHKSNPPVFAGWCLLWTWSAPFGRAAGLVYGREGGGREAGASVGACQVLPARGLSRQRRHVGSMEGRRRGLQQACELASEQTFPH